MTTARALRMIAMRTVAVRAQTNKTRNMKVSQYGVSVSNLEWTSLTVSLVPAKWRTRKRTRSVIGLSRVAHGLNSGRSWMDTAPLNPEWASRILQKALLSTIMLL